MEPILLKNTICTEDIDHLILKGVHDMDINQDKRDEIESESKKLSGNFVKIIDYHMHNGENPDASYTFRIAVNFNNFTEQYRQAFVENYKKDVLIGFGISAIWMGILNGLDAESGIMPNHPFKREIAACLRTISEILDNKG
ncbi:hypothetical protein [Labilibaculum euxinus]|uniref:Uncharacterized protein n=1 Tax=Labilibaculum euxinus TaxID=2686357 RepID=A0A7M4D9B1_9BACT|nr:hypothetical protein [Labilibaculum euxinus]MUP39240.1 hypothetical protein [Labilibaculum euxinus]MVB08445.1 hypothetical protein [Labilibaculum euxinus]